MEKASIKGVLGTINTYLSRNKLGELLVLSKLISAEDLRFLLKLQKETQLPLGQILIARNLISVRQLKVILLRQQVLRFVAALCLLVVTLTGFSKKARADGIEDVAAKFSLVSATEADTNFQNMAEYPSLFGADEKRSNNLSAFTKWTAMFQRFDETMKSEPGRKIVKAMQTELAGYKSGSIRNMAEKVNAMMNRQKYILDQNNWGKSDYWETPIEFMTRGGDCEDFAIAKYFAMRALGVPESRLRVAIVHDLKKNIPHAILVVYSESGPIILDNQSKLVLNDSSVTNYRPIFSINREGWWLHTAPESTVVASAR